MTGDDACLDRALARLPTYAEAYLEKHVVQPMSRGVTDDALDELRRRLAISAWLFATSEVLELASLYHRHAAHISHAFSADELAAVLASFGEAKGTDSHPRS